VCYRIVTKSAKISLGETSILMKRVNPVDIIDGVEDCRPIINSLRFWRELAHDPRRIRTTPCIIFLKSRAIPKNDEGKRYHQKMKLSKNTVLLLFLHALVSAIFILGIAGGEMRAWNVPATLMAVLPYVLSLDLLTLLVILLSLAALTGFLVVQMCFLKGRTPFNIMGVSMLFFLGLAAASLNSNSTQGPFSFLLDGFTTTHRLLTGRLSEKAWSADAWVPQASMMWWFLLWAGLIVAKNVKWMITKDSTLSAEGAPSSEK
jgi:hypothetical protein